MVTLREVARIAGVSLATASRVMNGYKGVSEKTRQHVLSVSRDLNYQYEYRQHARKNITIGVLLSKNIGENLGLYPTLHTINVGILDQCNDAKVLNSMLLIDLDKPITETLFDRKVDAYILVGTNQAEEDLIIPLLMNRRIPFVIVNRWVERRHISYVNTDDFHSVRDATLRMIAQGHRKVAFANGSKSIRKSTQRLEGFRAACQLAEISIREDWIFHGDYDEDNGLQVGRWLAQQPELPTLVITASDLIAIGVIKALDQHGIRVPEDVSVVGYGDVPAAAYFTPALTTVRMPAHDLGVEAVKAVLRMVENPGIRHIKLAMDSEFIARDSTRPLLPEKER